MDDGNELVPVLSASSIARSDSTTPSDSTSPYKSQGGCGFGSIQFFKASQKYKQNSKFRIVNPGEDAAPILETILKKWQLALPKLLIHVVGHHKQSGVDYQKSLGRAVARGLIQAISSTDVWLLTDGLHYGINKSVGKLLTDSATEISIATQHQIVAIGMGPSSGVSQFDTLQKSIGGPVEYQLQSTVRGTNHRLLDPSHTHFIIVNDRGQQTQGAAMSLRDSLIQRIAECKIQLSNANVPVVYIVFGGDEENLHSVYNAVVVKSIPVIIVAGSGGMADRLANAVSQPGSMSSGNHDNQTKIDKIMSPSYAHLVTVYNEDQEMNEALLQALMKANRSTRGQNELLLAIIWNRMDLVRKELSMNKNWMDLFQDGQLTEALQYALIHNRHTFVGLFLETDCLDLQKFLTRDCLVDLYHQTEPHSLLHKLLNDEKKAQNKHLEDEPDLKNVGSILKELIGLNSFIPSGYLADSTVKLESRTSVRATTSRVNNSFVGEEIDGQFRSLQKSFLYRVTPPDTSSVLRPLPWQRKLILFIEAPVNRFRYHLISHLLFLALFSYVILKDFRPQQSTLEATLMVWVITLFLEEFRELVQEEGDALKDRFISWLLGYWNIADLVALVMFSIGMVLRYNEDKFDAARIVLALDLIVFYLRILQFFSANRFLGPKLIMIVKMMMDIVTFISILFVFLVAYGVAFQSILYPDEQDSLTIVRGVLYQPYFQMYGELFLADLHKAECENTHDTNMTVASNIVCPENSWLGTLVLAFYLFISNIMLLNLLIAMLNYTFATVQGNTDTYWKYQRFQLVVAYHKRPALAPPFIVFVHIYLLIKAAWDRFHSKKKQATSSAMRKYIHRKDEKLYSDLSLLESIKGKDFLAAKEIEQNQDILYRLEQTDERLQKISSDTGDLGKDLTQRLESLETRVNQKLTTIASQMTRLEQLLNNLQGEQSET